MVIGGISCRYSKVLDTTDGCPRWTMSMSVLVPDDGVEQNLQLRNAGVKSLPCSFFGLIVLAVFRDRSPKPLASLVKLLRSQSLSGSACIIQLLFSARHYPSDSFLNSFTDNPFLSVDKIRHGRTVKI